MQRLFFFLFAMGLLSVITRKPVPENRQKPVVLLVEGCKLNKQPVCLPDRSDTVNLMLQLKVCRQIFWLSGRVSQD